MTADTAPVPVQPGYTHLIQAAIDKGLGADELGKLLDLEQQFHATQAKRAFNRAMHAAQAEMPVVVKDAQNDFTKKAYTTLEHLSRQIKPVYTRNGFVLSFSEDTPTRPTCIRVRCDVRHVDGHCEPYWMEGEPDMAGSKGGGNKTQVQGVGSTVSYLTRYLKLRIFDVTVADEDNDGLGYRITPEHVGQINDLWDRCLKAGCVGDFRKYLEWLGVEALDHLPMVRFEKATGELERRLREKRK